MHNNEEMAFVYTEIHVYLALRVQERSYENSVGQRHSTGEYEAASCKNEGCIVCEIGLLLKKKKKKKMMMGFWQIYVCHCAVYFAYFESFIMYKNTHRSRYVSKKAY